jgi:hypothetical protein
MSNEKTNIQADIDTPKSSAGTLLAYVEAAVIADMFKPCVSSKKDERSENK